MTAPGRQCDRTDPRDERDNGSKPAPILTNLAVEGSSFGRFSGPRAWGRRRGFFATASHRPMATSHAPLTACLRTLAAGLGTNVGLTAINRYARGRVSVHGGHGAASLVPVAAVPRSPLRFKRTTSIVRAPALQVGTIIVKRTVGTGFVERTAAGAVAVTRLTTWQRRGRRTKLGTLLLTLRYPAMADSALPAASPAPSSPTTTMAGNSTATPSAPADSSIAPVAGNFTATPYAPADLSSAPVAASTAADKTTPAYAPRPAHGPPARGITKAQLQRGLRSICTQCKRAQSVSSNFSICPDRCPCPWARLPSPHPGWSWRWIGSQPGY